MCDTFTFFSKTGDNRSFFAKNSDRDPGEVQIIEFINNAKTNFETDFLSERLPKYTAIQFEQLKKLFHKYEHPYAAIISRPTWMWGAEMGTNENGLSIGNEALFSKQKLIPDGLLGMDILRLALHNCANATEAVAFITAIIEKYGQGGNGSYSGNLHYHNSFLLKDINKAFVLETSAKEWAVKEIKDAASISNIYTIKDDYQTASKGILGKNLKKSFEKKLFSFFAAGDFRQNYSAKQIETCNKDLPQVFDILRSHIRPENKTSRGMKSICVHPGTIIKSETTSSFVVDYINDKQIIWQTSSPNPCVSLYKPMVVSANPDAFPVFKSMSKSLDYFISNRKLSEYFLKHPQIFEEKIKKQRNQLEHEFQTLIYTHLANKSKDELVNDCLSCYKKEQEYIAFVKEITEQHHGTN